MAEARREEEREQERREPRYRSQATGLPERAKTEHLYSCQGPLSTIRAAIKRTRTNYQGDHTRDRRRPEITVVSAEPLVSNSCFPGTSVVLASPQLSWSAGIQDSQPPPSYDQVIQEKTQEEHTVKPTAAPRQATCTSTSATQTDPVEEDPLAAVPQPTAVPRPAAGKKPQKPPRPSLPKLKHQQVVTVAAVPTEGKPAANTTASTNTEHHSDSQQLHRADFTRTRIRSVTVHWDTNPKHHCDPTAPAQTSEPSPWPVPLPRIKSRKQVVKEEVGDPILVKLGDHSDRVHSDPDVDVSSNEYLKELLEAFSEGRECEQRCHAVNKSGEDGYGEDAVGEMSTNQSQRNIWARIQAFETQASADEGNVAEPARPQPSPRKPSIKPPVAVKPSVALKPQVNDLIDGVSQNTLTPGVPQGPPSDPRPQPPKKPGASIKDELEAALQSKMAVPNVSPSVLSKANSFLEAGPSAVPPTPLTKPFKEPLKANLNFNNHNSASVSSDNEYVNILSDNFPVKPQWTVDSNGGSFPRQSLTRRPTTIRVPSKVDSVAESFLDRGPPLPIQNPVGSLSASVNSQQIPAPTPFYQDPFQSIPEPSLPPRRTKTLPPRPPPAKVSPGRPSPPKLQAAGRSLSVPWETPPKLELQKPQRKGLLLPPRPNPGHRLYNKYTLELAHGIAACDYNGSGMGELCFQKNEVLLLLHEIDHNTFACQVGDATGRVHKSRIKVITPLGPDQAVPPQRCSPAASGGDGYGQRVQVLHDFVPEAPGELDLRAGDVVTMVEQVSDEWYKGTCRGSTGCFPISYAQRLSDSPKSLPKRKPRAPSTTVSGPRCVARFDFEGEHSDELSLSEGDVVQLQEYVGDDWARGQLGVLTGIFPLNYVEVIEDLPPPPRRQQTLPPRRAQAGAVASVHPAQTSQSSEKWVVALYDYAGKSAEDLSLKEGDHLLLIRHLDADWSYGRLAGREGMFPRLFVEETTDQSPFNNPTGGSRARALYNFNSECEEELSLQVGDLVTNLESIDDEWFLGTLRGRRALVPKNYVEVE